jgi:protein involved in polysaccharide export with SLBB domain
MNNTKPNGIRRKGTLFFTALLLVLLLTSGCGNKFFDPKEVGRFNHTPVVNVILNTLGVAEEIPVAWEQGEEPRPIDTVAIESDYTFMSGDVIGIYVYELLAQGLPYEQNFVVSETGRITIPQVGDLQVKGKTELQLQNMIKNILSPNILINPQLTVTLIQSEQRSFSILGDGVRAPNRYPIPRWGFRLKDALAWAGGTIGQDKVSYVYVTRQVKESDKKIAASKNGSQDFQSIQSAYNLKEPITAESMIHKDGSYNSSTGKVVVSSSEMITDREMNGYQRNNNPVRSYPMGRLGGRNIYQMSDMQQNVEVKDKVSVDEALKRATGQTVDETPTTTKGIPGQPVAPSQKEKTGNNINDTDHIEWIFQNDAWVPVKVQTPGGSGKVQGTTTANNITDTGNNGKNGDIDWELKDGQWVPVQSGRAKPGLTGSPVQEGISKIEQELTWVDQGADTRLIKIPIDKLFAGDSRYDIVIKSGDSILVPVDIAGVYYLMGNLNRTGKVEMTGGMVTLKQAIATAGNLGPLAWPKRCEIIRRIGNNKEEIVRVDLDKIFSGEQPDIYIKPQDIINVGTHATSIWRAVLRNAFRATYGFGFVYDRNFADRDFYTSRPF